MFVGIVILGIILGFGCFFIMEHRTNAPQPTEAPATEVQDSQAESTDKPAEPSEEEPSTPNTTTHSTTDSASIWVVVNKQHPLNPLSYAPSDLTAVGNGQYMRSEAAAALARLRAAAQTAGNPVYALSGYRSYAAQSSLYNSYVKADGQAAADTYSARAGYSEHQTGLAVDVGTGTCNLDICFGDTAAGEWLATNAYMYGFIIRYPADKTATTGYQYEPWHLRYVGVELATQMHAKGIATLEEYFSITGGTSY